MSSWQTGVVSSFWLLAEEQDEAFLTTEMAALAQKLPSPAFQPHLTLLGDVPQAPETLVEMNAAIARVASPFVMPIDAIETSELFFRSFYARFETSPVLRALREAATTRFPALEGPFMPHVSLLYGIEPSPLKDTVAADASSRMKGRRIKFDRIAVTNSGNDVPIADWWCIDVRALGA